MSDPVSALSGARYEGLVTVADADPKGMITLRGDLSATSTVQALNKALGLPMPQQRSIITDADSGRSVGWMSPDELLLILSHVQVNEALAAIEASLAGVHHLAENVSDARAMITLTGPDAHLREVLAKLAPVDFHPDAFPTGQIRRTRLAQAAGAVWIAQPGQAHVICFRSVAQYVFDVLSAAADPSSAVEYFG